MELREREREINRRERRDKHTMCYVLYPIVAAVIVFCSLPPPPVIVAVTVMEYSVPSSRPVSVYILSLPGIPGIMVVETGEQSVSTLE